MADLKLLDRELLREKWQKTLAETWLSDGETVRWREIPAQGYVGSVVNQKPMVPHKPLTEVRKSSVEEPNWPLPSLQLTQGDFLGDEWADDPSVMWWAFADQPERDAVRMADHIANVPGEAFLAFTEQRVAVVVKSNQVAKETEEPQGLFGRARSVVQKAADNLPSPNHPVSYFEVPMDRITAIQPVHVGRSIPRATCLRLDFTDGSTFFVHSRTKRDPAEVFPAR
ncbi:hypothetical protein [Saccharopolyspora flava]|uniref:Uncharacterized protein n=1 Tax=Saccharopolyspora flava TaxID=95161 RepID=A0A1I6NTV9_9PSEU|nr:hypothetical protein [Saccharopolyspora flava]SFS31387.1 hypothetical protein SAMN05660874_00115 [Saccharopolyspora flava]